MGFFKTSIGEPKGELNREGVELKDLAAVQGAVAQNVGEVVLNNTAALAEGLATALKLAKSNAEAAKNAAAQQHAVAKGTKTQANKLAATAEGTDSADLSNAVQALASQVEPTQRYADTMHATQQFNDDAVAVLGGLLDQLNGGALQTLNNTVEQMNTSAGILRQAADAAAAHAPTM